jgi:hypothetical protein
VPELFRQAVAALRSVQPRPEVRLGEVRPPQRLAPWSFALSAEVDGPAEELATGRLVLLYDPDGEQAWDGVLRVVVYLRAELDPEIASDPLLPAVGWSWLTAWWHGHPDVLRTLRRHRRAGAHRRPRTASVVDRAGRAARPAL